MHHETKQHLPKHGIPIGHQQQKVGHIIQRNENVIIKKQQAIIQRIDEQHLYQIQPLEHVIQVHFQHIQQRQIQHIQEHGQQVGI
jgi:hypothetical protein